MSEKNRHEQLISNNLYAPLWRESLNIKYILFYLSIIIVLTLFAYSNSLKNDFAITFDDGTQIVNNIDIKDLTTDNFRKIFTEYCSNMYQPLSILSFALEYKLFGLDPKGYHIDNLILHLLNIILVFYFIYLLTSPQNNEQPKTVERSVLMSPYDNNLSLRINNKQRITISAIVVFFFAIHPMNTQSIAWIAARGIGLSTFFLLSGFITYMLYIKKQKFKFLVFTFILFILSLLSKSAVIYFPFVLILIDYYVGNLKREAGSWKYWLNKLPFFILAIIFGIISSYARQEIVEIEMTSTLSYSIIDKLFFVFYSAYFYIIKLFIPLGLCVHHYYPEKSSGILPLQYYLSVFFITLIIISVIKIKYIVLRKDIIFGLLFYLATIVFVLHIVPYSGYITSERYAYLPYVGLIFAIGQICLKFINNYKLKNHGSKLITIIFISAMVITALIFAFITYERNKIYKNNISLYTDEIKRNSGMSSLYKNRGNAKNTLGDYQGAINDFNKAIKINPKDSKFYYLRADVKASLKDMLGAVKDLNKAIEINPKYAEAIYSRGSAKYFLGDKEGAIEDYSKIIILNPKLTEAYNNRGMAKNYLGDNNGACLDWNKSASLGDKKAYKLIQKYCK
jgi:protein O-mannosyl-transferase